MLRKLVGWLAEEGFKAVVAAVLASAAVTSAVNALIRYFYTPSWELSWVIWSTTALAAYVALMRTAGWWLRLLDGGGSETERASRRAKREQLIAGWRNMAWQAHAMSQRDDYHGVLTRTLESDPRFITLQPYLSERSKKALFGRVAIVPPDGSTMMGALHSVLDDIERLEERWGLRP